MSTLVFDFVVWPECRRREQRDSMEKHTMGGSLVALGSDLCAHSLCGVNKQGEYDEVSRHPCRGNSCEFMVIRCNFAIVMACAGIAMYFQSRIINCSLNVVINFWTMYHPQFMARPSVASLWHDSILGTRWHDCILVMCGTIQYWLFETR